MHKALRANAPLSYPHLVTLFLKHLKVPLTNEPSFKVKRSFAIGADVVASFGYKKDLDGQWVCKQDYQANAPDERTPSPPPRDPSSALLNDVLNEIWVLHAFVGERFDSMDSCITRLEDDMGFFCRCFDPPTDPYGIGNGDSKILQVASRFQDVKTSHVTSAFCSPCLHALTAVKQFTAASSISY
ncbi:hypothetical protein HKD37_15G043020 [Glycine soja]